MFCLWGTVRDVRLQSAAGTPFYGDEEAGILPYEDLDEITEASERLREPSAQTLERVVPVAQRQTVGGVTVAIASLELYGEGLGVLRWQVSFEEPPSQPGGNFGIPEPWFEIRDGEGHALSWSPQEAGASDREANGDVRVEELPEVGELEVEVTRLVADAYEDGEYRGDGASYEGPWNFRFSL